MELYHWQALAMVYGVIMFVSTIEYCRRKYPVALPTPAVIASLMICLLVGVIAIGISELVVGGYQWLEQL